MASYSLTIDGTDRTLNVSNRAIEITDEMGSDASVMSFTMVIRDSGVLPECDQEVVITDGDDVKLFGGRILKLNPIKRGSLIEWRIDCVDYTRDLDRNLVVEGYEDKTDKEIIVDIVDNYCGGSGITYDNVTEGISISNMTFSYMPPSECFSKICKMTGRAWYIDYDKDVHYGVKFSTPAPFNII